MSLTMETQSTLTPSAASSWGIPSAGSTRSSCPGGSRRNVGAARNVACSQAKGGIACSQAKSGQDRITARAGQASRRRADPQARLQPPALCRPLHLPAADCRLLLQQQGPSLALWRAAEVAVLREQDVLTPVLDLGCGDGLVTSLALSHVDVGLDPDARALARAADTGIYSHLIAAPVETATLPPSSFATIVSNSVLEHLPNIDAVLAATARLLRPGGQLIFTAPTAAFSAWLALPSVRYAAHRNCQLAHRNLWSVEHWAMHLRQAGLAVESVRPYLRRPLVALWDTLELAQQLWISETRLISPLWRRIPPPAMARLAAWLSGLNLAALAPGGGHLIVARKSLSGPG